MQTRQFDFSKRKATEKATAQKEVDVEPVALAPRPLVTFDDLRIWTREDPPHLVPLVENEVQAHYNQSLRDHYGCENLRDLRGAREDIIKARQQGFSTDWLAIFYCILYNSEYSQSVIVTHHADSTAKLWARVQLFEQHLPEEKRRPLRYSNRRELVFADTGSSLFIGTAGQDNLLRSGTITNAHLSEMPSWAVQMGDVLTPLLGTLPAWGNLVFESTAKGVGAHYDAYMSHRDDPTSGYRAIFYGWDWTPEYQAPVPEAFERTPEEARLLGSKTGEPLSDRQLVWRRRMVSEFRSQGRAHEFGQEFPLTAEEAFLSSVTNSFFDSAYLLTLYDYWSRKGPGGELVHPPAHVIEPGQKQLRGRLEIYEDVDPDDCYVIGADVAKGIVKGLQGERRDYCVADVVSRKTERHVASYWAREGVSPDTFGHDLTAVGHHFHQALVICEANNHGILTLHILKQNDYPAIYYRKVNRLTDEGVPIECDEAGFETNEGRKSAAFGYLRRKITECAEGYGRLWLRGPRAIKELANLGNLPGGGIGALTGHDDHCTSLALCAVVLEEMPWIDTNRLAKAESRATAGGRR